MCPRCQIEQHVRFKHGLLESSHQILLRAKVPPVELFTHSLEWIFSWSISLAAFFLWFQFHSLLPVSVLPLDDLSSFLLYLPQSLHRKLFFHVGLHLAERLHWLDVVSRGLLPSMSLH